jgi:hypothetical protein
MKKPILRSCLLLAVAAALACVLVSHFYLRPLLNRLLAERNDARSRVGQLSEGIREADRKLQACNAKVTNLRAALDESTRHERTLEDQARNLSQSVDASTLTLQTARRELAQWHAIGIPPEQVSALSKQNRELSGTVSNLEADRTKLVRENQRLNLALGNILPEDDPIMPSVSGNVLVVDPKWKFVVLDIGQDAGLRNRGVLMLARNGTLIGKVRVRHVESNRSIADVLPDWELAEVHEGDRAMN